MADVKCKTCGQPAYGQAPAGMCARCRGIERREEMRANGTRAAWVRNLLASTVPQARARNPNPCQQGECTNWSAFADACALGEKCRANRVVGMGDSPPVAKPFDVQPLTAPNLKHIERLGPVRFDETAIAQIEHGFAPVTMVRLGSLTGRVSRPPPAQYGVPWQDAIARGDRPMTAKAVIDGMREDMGDRLDPFLASDDPIAEQLKAKLETLPCCALDTDGDGNCPQHSAPGVLRYG